MSQSHYRLANHTLAEPLIHDWQAWWMTVAPVPASLHLHTYQIPLLRAYLQSPDFHAKAAKDPQLSGTSFVGIPATRAGEVKALLQRMQEEQADRIKLAQALDDFQAWLLAEAKGQSLEPLYEKVPEPLKGRVELSYDYYNRPFVRVLEGLAYRSRFHKPELQSLRLSKHESDSARASLLSTPRLKEPGQIELRLPFNDARLDSLFGLDLEPRPLGYIRDVLGPSIKNDEELLPLLAEASPPPSETWGGPDVRVRYVGHACVLVEWKGVSILLDAVVAPQPAQGGAPRISFQDLPRRIDYVLITHSHPDHLDIETLLRLRHRIGHLVLPRASGVLLGDYSPKLLAHSLGFQRVLEPEFLEPIPLPDGEILAAPFLGEHGDLGHAKSSWLIRTGKHQMLFAADSTCIDEHLYRNLREAVGDIHTVFMNTEIEGAPHTWMLEALFPKKRDRKLEKNRRCRGSNAPEGLRLLELLGAKRLYNYAMGLEPWVEHIIGPPATSETPRMKESDRLLAECKARGVDAIRLQGSTSFHIES